MKSINIGNKVFELYWFTGTVLSATKGHETVVSGGGGGGYVWTSPLPVGAAK